MYKCWVCKKEFEEYESLRRHIGIKHKIHTSKVYVKIKLNDNWPTCSCGCGEKLKWTNVGFRKYILGHQSRVKNNWGHNKEAQRKSKETQKNMYKSRELIIWNNGLTKDDPRVAKYIKKMNTPERSNKISKALKGKKKTGKALIASRNNILNFHKSGNFNKSNTKPEQIFKSILKKLNIKYKSQWIVSNNNTTKIYDFYIPSKKILIEIDGDYYHCNPLIYKTGPINEIQKSNIENDKIKNNLALNMGYHIIRFWEWDLLNNKEWVINIVKLSL